MSKQFRTYELKLIPRSKRQEYMLRTFFVNADRVWKHIVENSITDTSELTGLNYKYLAAQFNQGMVKEFRSLLKSQHELKKLGKSGKIKYRKHYSVPHFSGQPITIVDNKHIKIRKLGKRNKPEKFYVRGLRQLEKLDSYRIVTIKLMKRATGYYLHITVECEIPEKQKPKKFLGLDFGIKTQVTISNGYNISYAEHSKLIKHENRIKRLQRARSRKQKGSRSYRYLNYLIRVAFEKLEYVKRNIINTFYSVFSNYYIVFQKELIKQWHQSGYKGIRRRVQRTFMGRILARLRTLEYTEELDSSYATTKTCLQCGNKNTIKLDERIYKCPVCGYTMPRDKHSALNMLRFFGFTYQECIFDSKIQFTFSQKEIARFEQAGICVETI